MLNVPPSSDASATTDAISALPSLGSTASLWLVAGTVVALVLIVPFALRALVLRRLKTTNADAPHSPRALVVNLLKSLRVPIFLGIALWLGSQTFPLGDRLAFVFRVIGVAAISLQFIFLSVPIIDALLSRLSARAGDSSDPSSDALRSSMGVLRFLGIGIATALIVLVALDNLNVQVTPLLTGLGIGGIAVALAAQNILGDLFASASILLDKPFIVGDFIVVGSKMGTVERIGVKTTRVRALSGEQLVFSNSQLLSAEIQNFKRMQERRATFTLSVTYDTEVHHLREIPGIVRSLIESREGLRFDRCTFRLMGAYSLDFETVYFVTSPDMLHFLQHQEAINLALIESFRSRGIEFAFPTQVEIQQEAAPKRVTSRI